MMEIPATFVSEVIEILPKTIIRIEMITPAPPINIDSTVVSPRSVNKAENKVIAEGMIPIKPAINAIIPPNLLIFEFPFTS